MALGGAGCALYQVWHNEVSLQDQGRGGAGVGGGREPGDRSLSGRTGHTGDRRQGNPKHVNPMGNGWIR